MMCAVCAPRERLHGASGEEKHQPAGPRYAANPIEQRAPLRVRRRVVPKNDTRALGQHLCNGHRIAAPLVGH